MHFWNNMQQLSMWVAAMEYLPNLLCQCMFIPQLTLVWRRQKTYWQFNNLFIQQQESSVACREIISSPTPATHPHAGHHPGQTLLWDGSAVGMSVVILGDKG